MRTSGFLAVDAEPGAADELVEALARLRVWRRASRSAPHKPLLVLLALARVQQGLPRLAPFVEVEQPLRQLIELVIPGGRGEPEHPFWRLQHDGIWEVLAAAPLSLRSGSDGVPATELRRAGASGGFLAKFHDALQDDAALLDRAARIVLRQLPSERRGDVLEALAWRPVAVRRPAAVVDRGYLPVDSDVLPAPARPSQRDPDLYGRGLVAHRRTQTRLAAFLADNGVEPRSPTATTAAFDLLWRSHGTTFVAEVKSVTSKNEEHQLRLGLGQVLRYRQALATAGEQAVAVLVAEREPHDSSWAELCQEVGVLLAWPGHLEACLGKDPKLR